MVSDKVKRLFIALVSSAICILIHIVESSNDFVASKSLVHVGLHWTECSMTNSMKLIIDCKVGFDNLVANDG